MTSLRQHVQRCIIIFVSIELALCSPEIISEMGMASTAQPQVNRGAARQMYGSGSLRQAGSNPISYGTGNGLVRPGQQGQHSTGLGPPMAPPDIVPLSYPMFPPKPPIVPYEIPIYRSGAVGGVRVPSGANYGANGAIYSSGNMMNGRVASKHRQDGGVYGGRGEYYPGVQRGDVMGGGHHVDLPYGGASHHVGGYADHGEGAGRFLGHGHAVQDPEEQLMYGGEGGAAHPCGGECNPGEYECGKSCMCIKEESRCDGDVDCEYGEDEQSCGDLPSPPGGGIPLSHAAGDMGSLGGLGGLTGQEEFCDEHKNNVRCPRSGKCIRKEWLCDGDDDCGDFSDETHCGTVANCTADQFECANGLCIQKTWVCDNDNDCTDSSDELNCTASGCNDHEFHCGDGTCISKAWKCDRAMDCADGSDELHCDKLPPACGEGEFQCAGPKCIRMQFRCDGENDCGDWSDEERCPRASGSCSATEYKCSDGKCLPGRWRCDKEQDCEGGEDEAGCGEDQVRTCSGDEFSCEDGKCILKSWMCDGVPDCSKGEDEKNCEIKCEEGQFTCKALSNDTSSSANRLCVNRKHVCDGQRDCPMGDDEWKCPSKRDCEPGSVCSQVCVTTSDGAKACSCQPGYSLDGDGHTCNDINECLYESDPVCSQTCNNTVGSFTCGCMTGYILRPDLRTCKALGAPPTLLFANRLDIRQVSLSNNKYSSILKGLHNAIALDYHYTKGYVFWSDVSTDVIRRARINGTGGKDIIKWGLESPSGVAVDWIHDLVFWTDSGTRRVEVASLEGAHRSVIIASDLDKPRAIAVHPGEAYVFWTDWGPNPKIERADMDGGNRRAIITEAVFWPNGLSLDYTTSRVFWADAKHHVIESADFNGGDRKKIISKGLPHPFAITLFEDAIYWTDWHTKSISTANKATGAGFKNVHSGLHFPMDIHSYHPQRQPPYDSHCISREVNGGCSHLCLPRHPGKRCACPIGLSLLKDGGIDRGIVRNFEIPKTGLLNRIARDYRSHEQYHGDSEYTMTNAVLFKRHERIPNKTVVRFRKTCTKVPEKLLLFARKKDVRLRQLEQSPYNAATPDVDMVVPVDGIKSAVALAWDSRFDYIYWTDVEKDTINRACLNGSHQKVIIHSNLTGLALDWLTDKLYWTDAGTNRIEVADSEGRMRALLVWEGLDKPRDIVVDPTRGYMYWSDWGAVAKIERAAMDGTDRSVVVSRNLTWPNGLAIDHELGRLYWADGGTKSIEYASMDGSGRKTLIGSELTHPFGLDVFKNNVYWTDWETSSIQSANKMTGKNRHTLDADIPGLMDVRVFHRERKQQPTPCHVANGGCSHLCLLKPNNLHSCACQIGVKLGDDGSTCAAGPLNSLIFAHRVDIRQISLDVPYIVDVVLPLPPLKNAMAVDVDRKTGEIYWTDTAEDVIRKATPDGLKVTTIIQDGLETADGLAIDSTGRKLYWTDAGRRSIEVSELDGSNRRVLVWTGLDTPRAIALHYHLGNMYWSDWGDSARIEVADMDGNNRRVLISEGLGWPNGLAIDRPAGRLYWNDGQMKTIESSDLQGGQRQVVVRDVPHPYGLVVVGTHIYWTDWKTEALHRADKRNGTERTVIRDKLEGLMDIRAVQVDNFAENACGINNGGCSHLCLRAPADPGYTCACSTGTLMKEGSKTQCQNMPQAYLLFATRASLARISLDTPELWDVTLPVKDVHSAVAVDFHWNKQMIFYTDVTLDVVRSVNMNNLSEVRTIISGNLDAPNGLAVDWIADNIYWSDNEMKAIEVARLDGTSRKVIVNEGLDVPRALVVYPKKGYLFWTDWGDESPRIERSALDGSGRKTIISGDLGFPNGLAVDYDTRRIYWADALKDRIETSDLHGRHRVQLVPEATHPFGMTQYGDNIYWTDWYKKSVVRADKTTGTGVAAVKTELQGVMEIRAVAHSRQPPSLKGGTCGQPHNGGCSHLCLYRGGTKGEYVCACPDKPQGPGEKKCVLDTKIHVSPTGPDDIDEADTHDDFHDVLDNHGATSGGGGNHKNGGGGISATAVIVATVTLTVLLFGVLGLIGAVLYNKKKTQKKYHYGSGRSVLTFSNPNYSGGAAGTSVDGLGDAGSSADKKPRLWSRIKYDKSQDRVYEDKATINSPEVISLIPGKSPSPFPSPTCMQLSSDGHHDEIAMHTIKL